MPPDRKNHSNVSPILPARTCYSSMMTGSTGVGVDIDPLDARPDVGSGDILAHVITEDFDTFYAREYRSVVGLARVLCGRGDVAEDLAQEAFVAAYRHWARIESLENPSAWVRRVVANSSVSGYRRRASEAKLMLQLTRERTPEPAWDKSTDDVWRAVRRLPRRQAQAVVLKYLDRRTVKEMAEILRCSPNTVKTHLARGREALARSLGQELGNADDR